MRERMKIMQSYLPFDSTRFSHLKGEAGVRYTIAIGTKLFLDYGEPPRIVVSLGVSRCSISDQFVKRIGRIKALGRATQAFCNYLRVVDREVIKPQKVPFHTIIPHKGTHINLITNKDIETLLPIKYVPIVNKIVANQIVRRFGDDWEVDNIIGLLTTWSYE